MSTKIKNLKALEILDSRGNPTLQVKAVLADDSVGTAAVPSGASTGEREAMELRDDDGKRFGGKGVLKAAMNVNEILAKELENFDGSAQSELDQKMIKLDGSENKSKLGANAILGVSLAVAKAVAESKKIPFFEYLKVLSGNSDYQFPRPMMNVINGGKHADSGLDIQEFMIIPKENKMSEMVRTGAEVFQSLKKVLESKGEAVAVGDEGGFAPRLSDNRTALEVIVEAVTKAGYEFGKHVQLGLDVAASSFYDKEKKVYRLRSGVKSSAELLEYYEKLIQEYPIISIEDPFDENDWPAFKEMTARLGSKLQIVGDDLFVTNVKILKRGIEEKAANAVLIKLNQIGTLSETLETINLAKRANFKNIISHRSGETCDTTIADLAYGTGAGQIKTGSLCRSERVGKYNRLLEIEQGF